MIVQKIPHKARFIPVSVGFSGLFNTPVLGGYSFEIAANLNHLVLTMDVNSIYFIDTIQIGGNIPSDVFNDAIKIRPYFILKKSLSNETVYPNPIYLINYSESRPVTAFVSTNKGGETLLMDLHGEFSQTVDMIGLSLVKVDITLNIYAMDSKEYNQSYNGDIRHINLSRI